MKDFDEPNMPRAYGGVYDEQHDKVATFTRRRVLAGGLNHHVVLWFAETNYVNSTTFGSSKLETLFIKVL